MTLNCSREEEGAIPEQPSPTFDSELGISGCWFDLPGSVRSAGQGWVHCSDDPIRGTTNGPQVHTILHVVLLKLGQDVLAIGVLPKSRDVWPDLEKISVGVTLARESRGVSSTFPARHRLHSAHTWCFIPHRYFCPLIASKSVR